MELYVLFFTSMISYGAAINSRCPAHLPKNEFLREFGNSCYEFILDHPGDWHHADADCRIKNGYLVDIQTYSEQGFLFNACQELGFHDDKGLWIGLTDGDDYSQEGTWHWVSNNGISFANWGDGQPGMVGGLEDCVLMQFSDHGQWHDYPCQGFLFLTENHGWICEYPLPTQNMTLTGRGL
ncbi:C-type lectin domain family 4 member G-like [Mercenaria mercenaria]|uniref:C-type lectin domain family 4 member G-like n=1 Tax=Mercenaria mercenaria TaxID=6596 RepID=UPI00234E3E3B|nr:C-type lectin domain family 4 member G-like [Mercenaria mercenaria]